MKESRRLSSNSPKESLVLARQAYEAILQSENESLRIDCALNLISRLMRLSMTIDRDLMIDEWQEKIAYQGSADQRCGFANLLAIIHLEKSEFATALNILRECTAIFPDVVDPRIRTMIKINLASAYSGLSINDKATQWFYEALDETIKSGDLALRCHVHNNLGILHRTVLDLEPAVKQFEEVMRIAEETGNLQMRANACNNLCGSYFYLNDFEKSMEYSNQAYDINLKIENRYGVQAALNNIGMIHQRLGDYDKALQYFEEALPIASSLGNKHAMANILKNVGDIHLARKELNQVIPLYDKAREIADEIADQALLNDLYAAYVAFFEQCEDWERTVKYMRSLLEVKQLLFTSEQRSTIDKFRIQHEMEQKEREREILIQQNTLLTQEVEERRLVEIELKEALSKIKVLTGLLPVCSHCKKIRDKAGEWHQMEHYISTRTEAQFSHGICPDCRKEHYDQV